MSDWIPSNEREFVDLCLKWQTELTNTANIARYGWSEGEVAVVLNKIAYFLESRAAFEADDSTANRQQKDDDKAGVKKAMRDFANSSIRFNPKMTEVEKGYFGVRRRDTTLTVHPAPEEQPETVAENTKNHFEHMIIALNPDGKTSKKPNSAHGVKTAYQVGGERPATGEDLPKSVFSVKTSVTIRHTEAVKGKPAYYATRYENAKGEGGPWSPIVEAYIG